LARAVFSNHAFNPEVEHGYRKTFFYIVYDRTNRIASVIGNGLSSNHDQSRTLDSRQGFAPWTGRQQTPPFGPMIRTNEHDVSYAPYAAMLERVIHDGHVRSLSRGLRNSEKPVGGNDDGNSGLQTLVNKRLVPSVSSQHDRGMRTSIAQLAGDPR
jgi:hypothetical protein